MARIKKKGVTGQAKNYITRTQAVRKLQISLPDFRRLCIFKGIYPRQPRNRQKAAKNSTPSTTFYYAKDIQYLLHEPLLNKFREHNALAKKIAKALGKGQDKDAARLEKTHAPRMTLDHIVKERYPTFQDALKDLDDALSMLFLFANLPSHMNVPPKTIRLCQRLCHEFQHYLIISHSLRKSFLSIKGIYYQASIQGQDILWLVPYNFVQRVTGDIDFRIMATFVEFYTTLLGFVNFRLYTTAGLVYPPKFNASSDEQGAALTAFTLQARQINGDTDSSRLKKDNKRVDKRANKRAQSIADSVLNKYTIASEVDDNANASEAPSDDEEIQGDGEQGKSKDTVFTQQAPVDDENNAIELPHLSSSEQSQKAGSLFKPFVFYLSRETPRQPLEFLLKAFGCARIGWDATLGAGAFTHDESDERITHQVVDRPPQPVSDSAETQPGAMRGRIPGRTYVQPQWVWDCVNVCDLLGTEQYVPGATLPPHLSPFVKPRPGEYDPRKPLDGDVHNGMDEVQAEEGEDELDEADGAFDGLSVDEDQEDEDKDKDVVEGVESVKDLADLNSPAGAGRDKDAEIVDVADADSDLGSDFGGFSESDDDYARELQAETSGASTSKPQLKSQSRQQQGEKQTTKRKQAEEEWKKDRQKMMMSRKQRELYKRMEYGNRQREEADEKLRVKRRKLEKNRA
ncbi:MAG: hypothetical protein Q9162_000239 [Coniocarpon cinnabarinum]